MADDDARRMPCWPYDRDWLDGRTEIFLTTRHLKAYWDADIIDDDKNKHDNIIERNEAFLVRFRVELKGRLWYCLCGHWCFNLGFTAIGKGEDFNLSDVLPNPKQLYIQNWKGCDKTCIQLQYRVPAGTIEESVYELTSTFRLYCCAKPAAIVGFEPKEEYQWYA